MLILVGLCAGAVLLGVLPSLWLAPVQLIAVFEDLPAGARVVACLDKKPQQQVPLRSWTLPQTCRVTIKATGRRNPKSGAAVVFVAPIVDSDDAKLSPDGYQLGPGWAPWELGGRWIACPKEDSPATMTWSGRVADRAVLPMPMFPDAGIVTVQWSEEAPRTIDLYSPTEKWHTETYAPPAATAKWIGRLPFSFDSLGFQVAGGEAVCRRVTVLWGERVLFDRRDKIPIGGQRIDTGVPAVRAHRIFAWASLNALRAVARACVWMLVSLLVGLPLAWPILGRLNWFERYAAMLVAGSALPIILSISLTRIHCDGSLSFWLTIYIMGTVTVNLLAQSAWRGANHHRHLIPTRADAGVLLSLMAVALVCSLVMFYPILSFPNWFVGQSYTDTQYYINSAEAFRHESLNLLKQNDWATRSSISHLIDPNLGYTDRSGDFLGLLNAALLHGTDTRSALAQLHLNWWFIVPLISYCLFSSLGCRPQIVWGGVVSLSASALLYAIFTQDYLAHFLSAMLLLDLLLVSGLYVSRLDGHSLGLGEHASFIGLLAVLLASSIGTYPSQCLFPVVLAVIMLGRAASSRSWQPVWLLAAIGVATIGTSNLGLIPLFSTSNDTAPHLKALNEIARNVVFTFYPRPVVFGSVIYGIRDWALFSSFARRIMEELVGDNARWLCCLSKGLAAVSKGLLVPCVLLTLTGIRDCLRRSRQGQLLAIAAMVYILAGAVLGLQGQVYASCKQLITCGVLCLPCMIVGMDTILRKVRRQSVHAGLGVLFVAFLVCNLRSMWFDNSAYLMTAYHPVLFEARTHVGALTEDLRELANDRQIRDRRGNDRLVAIVGDYIPGRRTDRDRVTMGYVHHVFRGYRVIHDPTPEQWRDQRPLLALVFNGFSLPADMARSTCVLLANTTFVLYGLDEGTGGGS